MSAVPWDRLFEAASAARTRAHAPYSKFAVGAALLTDQGAIVSGCNVENASYGLALCAERNAVGTMVTEGGKRVVAVAILVDSQEPTPPCGMCRQVMAEFGEPSLPVTSRALNGKELRLTLGELLPHAFTREFL